ncbi:MAG: hypothetical protein RSC10_09050, partial [Longicatena sp.]
LERFDVSKLNGLDMQFNQTLKKCQDYTEMTDNRIETLVEGLSRRIKTLKIYKAIQSSQE